VKPTSYEAPHYVAFFSFPPLPLSLVRVEIEKDPPFKVNKYFWGCTSVRNIL